MTKHPKKVTCRPATIEALLAAFKRLANSVGQTGQTLGVEDVATEAGVSRSTAYRCTELIAALKPPAPAGEPSEVNDAAAEPAKLSTERGLRRMLRIACNRIVLLEERLREAHDEIVRLRRRCGDTVDNVIPIRR